MFLPLASLPPQPLPLIIVYKNSDLFLSFSLHDFLLHSLIYHSLYIIKVIFFSS